MTVHAFADVIGTTLSFDASSDQILFPLGYSAGWLAWRASGADTVVTCGSGSVTLSAVSPGDLDDSHFAFEDGSVFHLGDAADEAFSGSQQSDLFDLRAGGEDTVEGGSGADRFILGSALGTGDSINGGSGDDWIFLDGIHEETVVLSDTTIRGVEFVVFEAGSTIHLQLSERMLTSAGRTVRFESAAPMDAGVVLLDGRQVTRPIDASTAAGDDTLLGGAGKDRLEAKGGDNIVAGHGGDDWLGAGGRSTLLGGVGGDVLEADADAGDLVMHGGNGSDRLKGGGGADVLYAAGWHDLGGGPVRDDVFAMNELSGGGGNDTLLGDAGRDTLHGGDGDDLLEGGEGDDELRASNGIDTLRGGEGNDTLWGAPGGVLEGGGGDDTYYVSSGSTVVVELSRGGNDFVRVFGGTYTLPDHVESGALSNAGTLTGNDLANDIYGSTQADTLSGGGGDDWLYGIGGADRLEGGDGNDTYVVDEGDVVVEHAGGGHDRVIVELNQYEIPLDVEFETVELGQGRNGTILGNAENNWLVANDASCTLQGGAGSDTLQGAFDDALLAGGTGDDTYVVVYDRVRLQEKEGGGVDLVEAAVSWTLGAYQENLTLVGTAYKGDGNALDNVLRGNAGNNLLDGRGGADTLVGGGGDDTLRVDHAGDVVVERSGRGTDTVAATINYALTSNVENLVLLRANTTGKGNALNNRLSGLAGTQVLDGGAGVDTMLGGGGDDVYLVDDARDRVMEDRGTDRDTVKSVVDYALPANVETLVLNGSRAIRGVGNDGHNLIVGNAWNNKLYGRFDNDTLQGGAGRDTLVGGAGGDTYYVDTSADVVAEDRGGAADGPDLVISTAGFYRLGAFVEDLTLAGKGNLSGAGNALTNTLRGNSGHNRLDGGGGRDELIGGRGNDTYVVDHEEDIVFEERDQGTDTVISSISYELLVFVENIRLSGRQATNATGNNLANRLDGNAGANRLDGRGGKDTLAGGAGNDVYIADASDVVLETAGGGIDTVITAESHVLAANVENVTLDGPRDVNATGNALGNRLIGNDQDNILDGGRGADTMDGGDGADIYIVDHAGDIAAEAFQAYDFADAVVSTVNHSLGQNIEILVLVGTAVVGTGNAEENVIVGNAQDNVLSGGFGWDELVGGKGNDRFVFRKAGESGPSAWDVISDFTRGADKIDLSALDADTSLPGLQKFLFAGNNPELDDSAPGLLRYVVVPGGVRIFAGTDRDFDPELVIDIAGISQLDAGDFIL